MDQNLVNTIAQKVIEKISKEYLIPIEASARHVHLSQEDAELLFGKTYQFTVKKNLSQPGQCQYDDRVMLIGPKGVLKGVAILGPARGQSQIEISRTDAFTLGINPPIRESGDLKESETLIMAVGNEAIKVEEGVIIAKRHIHMNNEDARIFGLKDKESVKVKILSNRPVVFEDVTVRISDQYLLSMHIDYDEANAINHTPNTFGRILL